jgi:hypothetical protein
MCCLSIQAQVQAQVQGTNKIGKAAAQAAATHSREVSFMGAAGFRLQGTLLLPASHQGARCPAVLLLAGSGPPDRDGNVRPTFVTDLLKQIAERLARQGIATLRYDKRSVAAYAALWPRGIPQLDAFFSYDHFVGDALAGYRFLRAQPEIDPRRVGIAGHSEGGLLTLQVAHDLTSSREREKEAPRAIVLLSTGGRPLDVILHEQLHALLPKQIADPKTLQSYLDYSDRAIAQLKTQGTVPPNAPPGLGSVFNPTALQLLHAEFAANPVSLARAYRGAVLIVQGEKDTQVSAQRDAPALEAAFRSRKQGSCKLLPVPQASHNLKHVAGDGDPGFGGPVVPVALDGLASWLKTALSVL